jgi:hypothetical protein
MSGVLLQRAELVNGRVRLCSEWTDAVWVAPGLAVRDVDGGQRIVHRPSGRHLGGPRCVDCTDRVVVAAVGSGIDWTGSLAQVVRDKRFRVFRAEVRASASCRRS